LKINLNTVLATPMANGAADIFQTPEILEARIIAEIRAKAEASSFSRKFTFVPGVRRLPA